MGGVLKNYFEKIKSPSLITSKLRFCPPCFRECLQFVQKYSDCKKAVLFTYRNIGGIFPTYLKKEKRPDFHPDAQGISLFDYEIILRGQSQHRVNGTKDS